ncbi:MAG TPA: hypothetical protein VK989_11920, partial [Polyangia bacterium]|nr:hypothetical protein [Polyangia bacterium]
RFSAGVSVLYGTLLEAKTLGLGGYAQLQWRRVTVTGEYLAEHFSTGGGASTWAHQGAVVEPGVFLAPRRIELVLRGAWYRQPAAITTTTTDATDTFAVGAGLTLFGYSDHVRLQGGLELRRTRDARLPDSDWGIIRATFVL